MKRATTSSKKTRKIKSGSGDKSKTKKCVKNVEEQQKKPIQSSHSIQVAGTSRQSDSGEIPSTRPKRLRGKKANIPEQNSDSEKKSQKSKKNRNNEEEENKEEESISSNSDSEQDPTQQKIFDEDYLRRVDPEFHNFLNNHNVGFYNFEDHDRVLDDTEDDDDKDDIVIIVSSWPKQEPPEPHEAAAGAAGAPRDDSDGQTETTPLGEATLETVQQVQIELQESNIKLGTIKKTVKLFTDAVLMATSRDAVTGADVFRAVLDTCVVHLPNAVEKFLDFETSGGDAQYPQTSEKFHNIKSSLIEYLSGLVDLLLQLSSDCILTSMLKHLHQLCKYVACFSKISKKAIKHLLPLWSHGTKTIRIQSFTCIIGITRKQEQTLLLPVIKAMFWTYLKNCKFVRRSTWPNIHFMRRALVEMIKLNVDHCHMLVLTYVRQLGIHLRNALLDPQEEHSRVVFNWQFMNALHLWAELASQMVHHIGMKNLYFDLVMIISYSIRLGSTPQYYPLRFYLIEMLIMMQEASGQFITILPFFTDVIKKFDINKKHKERSKEPLDFSCIIRLSKSQMKESGFKDAVVERLHALLLKYTVSISCKNYFPECSTGLILFLRELVEKCENSNHKKKLQKLFNKIEENSNYMFKNRSTYSGGMVDLAPIVAWEETLKAQGTPLLNYYENWKNTKKPASKVSDPGNPKKKGVTRSVKK